MTRYTPSDIDSNDWNWAIGDLNVDEAILGGGFLYDGTGLSLNDFRAYVDGYSFGSMPPCFVVLHHTSIPDTQVARLKDGSWDAREIGLTEQQIYTKRQKQLSWIRDYYRDQLGWDRGPHLFIDDRWIWIFTPMYHPGIHAAKGNGTAQAYSIGIEVVGHYEHVQWPEPVARNVGGAIAVLHERLKTFKILHKIGPGGISSHRDYNKPACPGAAITEEYYLSVIRNAMACPPHPPSVQPNTPKLRVIGIGQQRMSQNAFCSLAARRGFGLSEVEAVFVYQTCERLNVCAAFVAATALAEHGGNLQESSRFRETRNPGNMMWYDSTPYDRFTDTNKRTYRIFESSQIGFLSLILHLKDAYGSHMKQTTLEDIVPTYLAHSESENNARIARMLIDIQHMTDVV